DMLYENALSELAEAYDGKTDVYYGNALVCDEEGNDLHVLKSLQDLSSLPYGFCIVHPATFVAKKAYDNYGTFRKELKCAMDYDLLLRYYKKGAVFKYIDKTLSVYRIGGTNMKMRNRTIKEVRDVSIYHGGNPIKANMILVKKKLREKLKFIKVSNKRVEKI
ncbi:MAG: hypothetical protein IJB50_04405, partial [Clostridia bacterium]|nr:hypothetical protein [Clostridia bacterium]